MRSLIPVLVLSMTSLVHAAQESVEERLRQADQALNKAYDALLADLADEPTQKLREAQRAWLRYRARKCDFEAGLGKQGKDWISEAARPAKDPHCLLSMTRQRTAQLKAYQRGQTLSRRRTQENTTTDESVPEGPEGLRYLVNQGKLRPASPRDFQDWIEQARANNPDADTSWDPEIKDRFTDYYVVQGSMRFPDGLGGANAAGFIIPADVHLPEGDPGHSTLLFLRNGTCQGLRCPSPP